MPGPHIMFQILWMIDKSSTPHVAALNVLWMTDRQNGRPSLLKAS